MLGLLAVPAAVGLGYLFCYGGLEGPIDWAMGTTTHASRDLRRLALTFDDGPDPDHTPRVLDTLAALELKATFFVVGKQVDAHPDLVERIVREGHELGNHTYHHRYLPLTRSRTVLDELARTDAAIARVTGGAVPRLARPPYGGRSPRNVRAFAAAGKQLVLWDVNSFDWKGKPPADIAARVLSRARPGSIVLLHDVCPHTPEAVRMIAEGLRGQAFELDTVSNVLA
jgi:peptidoglycan/xylan/chitin deacetylase (PgdA/CDA1 family)